MVVTIPLWNILDDVRLDQKPYYGRGVLHTASVRSYSLEDVITTLVTEIGFDSFHCLSQNGFKKGCPCARHDEDIPTHKLSVSTLFSNERDQYAFAVPCRKG